jgi:putative iron-only hydrogenase system regulator
METRVAAISIILESAQPAPMVNDILNQYNQYVVGRMGIPYKQRGLSIISIVIDAPQDIISTMSGKLGKLKGVSAKATYSKYTFNDNE